jgi:hypothetical protein
MTKEGLTFLIGVNTAPGGPGNSPGFPDYDKAGDPDHDYGDEALPPPIVFSEGWRTPCARPRPRLESSIGSGGGGHGCRHKPAGA